MKLIDADVVVKIFEGYIQPLPRKSGKNTVLISLLNSKVRQCIETINILPPNYVEKHGHWTHSYDEYGLPSFKCSSCGEFVYYEDAISVKYCPWCGSKMDGGVNGEN